MSMLVKLQSSKIREIMNQFTMLCKTFGRIKRSGKITRGL